MAAGELSRLLDQDGDGGVDEAAERVEQAEIARAQAESDAAEGNRRLQVARQQFAEYAESKATEAAGLGAMIRDLLNACEGVGAEALTKKVCEIKETMDAAEAEARAMASDASSSSRDTAPSSSTCRCRASWRCSVEFTFARASFASFSVCSAASIEAFASARAFSFWAFNSSAFFMIAFLELMRYRDAGTMQIMSTLGM